MPHHHHDTRLKERRWRQAMDGLTPESRALYELLKGDIGSDLERKLKESQDAVIASLGKTLSDQLQGFTRKLDSVREDLGVDIGQIRLDRDRDVRPEPAANFSSPPTPLSAAGTPGRVYTEVTLGEKEARDKATGAYVPPQFRGMRDANPGKNPSFPFDSSPRAHTEAGYGPRVELPRFDGTNPRLWQSRCEDYFQLWGTSPSLWIPYASAQFEGAAARWLESVQRRAPRINWKDFCQLLQARFGRNQHQQLIRRYAQVWLEVVASIIICPSFLLLLFYVITPESPRFLCMKGRITEATDVLEKMARLNNVPMPSGRLVSDKNIELDVVSDKNIELDVVSESATLLSSAAASDGGCKEENDSIKEDEGSNFGGIKSVSKLLSPKLLRATVLLWMAFFGNAFSYFGIVLLTSELSNGNRICAKEKVDSVHSNNSSLYKNVFISSFAEIPGSLVSALIVDRVGRKLSMASMLFTGCVFLFPLVFSQTDILTRISLFGARLCIAASFTIVYIYAPEIYPTSVRTTGIGVASSVGRIGGILCPLVAVALVHNCHQTTAILLFELVVFLSGVAVMFFPFETKGCRLNDTVADLN